MPRKKDAVKQFELKTHDHKRKTDFLIKRTLSGWAKRPTSEVGRQKNGFARTPRSQSINFPGAHSSISTDKLGEGEELLDIGISVSDEEDIIERRRPNDTFATHCNGFTHIKFSSSQL
jgi:hypothetical protein